MQKFFFPSIASVFLFVALGAQAGDLNDASTLTDSTKPYEATQLPAPPTTFATTIGDLPLMPGLSLVKDDDVLFVTPREGRIATTDAQGAVDVDDVYNFYRRSLPQLGWKFINARTYEREGERLRIDAKAVEKVTTVKFTISPSR